MTIILCMWKPNRRHPFCWWLRHNRGLDNWHSNICIRFPIMSISCWRVVFTLMSWLSNEPTNVGSLLFATNYWTSVLMHGWMRIFVTRLFGDLFRLFQSCPHDYQTNGARVRATGIVGILTKRLTKKEVQKQGNPSQAQKLFMEQEYEAAIQKMDRHKNVEVRIFSRQFLDFKLKWLL